MIGFLTLVAIQLKGPLAALLGLGGMYTTVRSLITGLGTLPKIDTSRPSTKWEGKQLVRSLRWQACISVILFLVALTLYFAGPIAAIDDVALKKGAVTLDVAQRWAIAALSIIAVAMVVLEFLSTVQRNRLGKLPTVF